MCFYIHPYYRKEKIANKDIVCYKRLCYNFISPYQQKPYKLNKLYKSSITIIEVFHAFIITKGLHSYSYKRFAISQTNRSYEILVKGIIPRGSKYYYNPDRHEYVSNQIILQEIIKK